MVLTKWRQEEVCELIIVLLLCISKTNGSKDREKKNISVFDLEKLGQLPLVIL